MPAIQILIMFIFGVICALIAHSRGRTPIGWFCIGFVAPCLGLILVLVLPNLQEEEERRLRLEKENRRLKERLRKDRQVADRRYEETRDRLQVHDQALGVDTQERAEPALAAIPPPPPPAPTPAPEFEGTLWYYVEDREQAGPVEFAELKRLYQRHRINPTTLVWHESMEEWQRIETLVDLQEALDE